MQPSLAFAASEETFLILRLSFWLIKFLSYVQRNILNDVYDIFFHSTPRCETRDNIKTSAILRSTCITYVTRQMIS
jgi:hypothetical protein